MLRYTTIAMALCCAAGAHAQTGRAIQLTSAPAINHTLNITVTYPAAEVGNAYAVLWSVHTNTVTNLGIPAIVGPLFLDLGTLHEYYNGTYLPGGSTTKSVFTPNLPILIGQTLDIQSVDLNTTLGMVFLADNEVVITDTLGVGSAVFVDGSATAPIQYDLVRTQNASMGVPSKQNPSFRYDPQIIQVIGYEGWSQNYLSNNGSTDYNCDTAILRGDRVARDMRDATFQSISLPGGKSFAVVRDVSNPKDFLCITVDQHTGLVTELTGSRMTSASTLVPAGNAYANLWGFSPDGSIAVGMVDRDNAANVAPAPDDAIVLIRTDNSFWPASGTATLDISPIGGLPQWFDGNVIVANEVVFVRGNFDTFWAPLDGSAKLAPVAFPNTGTAKPNAWIFSRSYRVSRDGKTMVLPIGGNALSTQEHDMVAITNIDKTGTFTIKNISAFPVDTVLKPFFGDSRSTETTFTGVLSPDGKRLAFVGAVGGAATPNVLYVAPTDGSAGGTLAKVAGFPATVTFMGLPHILPNGHVVVFAGTAANALDLYKYDPTGMALVNLTNVGNIDVPWSLQSDNGKYLYFGRDYTLAATSEALNIVAVTPTGALKDITGAEFSGGTAPSQELSITSFTNEFRQAPGASTEIYFVGRPLRGSATLFFDQNVYKFDFENGGTAVAVTSNSGSGSTTTAVKSIQNLNVQTDGSVVYAEGLGTPLATRPQSVMRKPAAALAPPINLGEFARGFAVVPGTLRLVEGQIQGAYWVQATNTTGSTAAIGYFAHLSGTMDGHPLLLTGLPVTATRTLAILTTGAFNP